MRRSIAPVLGITAGLAFTTIAARRVIDRPDAFYAWPGERDVRWDADGSTVRLPITYHRSEQIVALHAAAFEPLRALLPTDALHPVRLPDGRALLALSAARYLEGTAPGADPGELPYGEMMATVVVTPEPSPPLVPLLRAMLPGSGAPAYGVLLLHVAMTNRAAANLARAFGYPAFIADFTFEDDVHERRVAVSEGGREILRLSVASRGRVSADRRPMRVYSVRDGQLLEALVPCSGLVQQSVGARSGLLELGDHPVAESLRALQPLPRPLMTRSYLNLRMLIPPPRVVGVANAYAGYAGPDRDTSRYTVGYPDGTSIDLQAPRATPPERRAVAAPRRRRQQG